MFDIRKSEYSTLLLSIIICQAAGIVGQIFTRSSLSDWYPMLVKPSFTPPGWFIGLIWVVLFTLMGLSLFLVWRKGPKNLEVRHALYFFAAQLIVNILWSAAFFGLRSPQAGMIVIAILLLLILATIIKFWSISKEAALFMVPYLIWVSFASYLTYVIFKLNS
jgi:benzodiazapine receptor